MAVDDSTEDRGTQDQGTHTTGRPAATGGTGGAAAGMPGGDAPSGPVEPGSVPVDGGDMTQTGPGEPAAGSVGPRITPGQAPQPGYSPVPAPGDAPGSSVPAVETSGAASPEDGLHQGGLKEGTDASVTSPGQFVALAVPGHPDGEVDTRTR